MSGARTHESTQRLVWHEGQRYSGADSWGNAVPIDADEAGAGAKPADLLPLSLAACTAYDIVNILTKQRQVVRALQAEILSTQDADAPWTFRRIEVRYTVRGLVDATKAQKAMRLSEEKYCSVSATLRPVVELVFGIEVVPD